MWSGTDEERLLESQMCDDPVMPRWCRNLIPTGIAAIDVGANQGEYITLLSELVGPEGHVYAIEPGPRIREEILLPLVARYTNVSLYGYAFGEEAKVERVFHYRDWTLLPVDKHDERYWNRQYHPGQRSELKEEFTAHFISLDAFVSGDVRSDHRIGFIKIDVDGAEFPILRGAVETLHRHRPILYVEMGIETSERLQGTVEQSVSLLLENGYRLIANYRWNPIPVSQEDLIIYLENTIGSTADILCLPREHPANRKFV
jgi:FkbM family methyltransferase